MAFDLDDEELKYNREHPLGVYYRERKTIVLCGSKRVKTDLLNVQKRLIDRGYNVLIPEEFEKEMSKSKAIKRHFQKIEDKDTDCILVVNTMPFDLDIDNYIGPNTFAEIMFAYYKNKPIYLLQDYYDYYIDELMACNVKCLNGNLNNLY